MRPEVTLRLRFDNPQPGTYTTALLLPGRKHGGWDPIAGNVDGLTGQTPQTRARRAASADYRCNKPTTREATGAAQTEKDTRMTKRAESKYKINRRLGVNLWGRPKSPVNKREYGPGQHGQRRKKPSDFGVQLMAKQKLKGYYGNIGEKQFRKYYEEAVRRKGDTSENLIELLERRLDAVIYRMKFAITPFAARQFVNHGHVMVNGKRVNISVLPGARQRHHRGEGEVQAARHGAGRRADRRARCARLSWKSITAP